MRQRHATFPLRLPESIKTAAQEISQKDGTSLNQFIAIAVAEKIAVMKTADFFEERRRRADWDAFDRILNREGGQPPIPGDEMPEDLR
jgi:hypothetical protein